MAGSSGHADRCRHPDFRPGFRAACQQPHMAASGLGLAWHRLFDRSDPYWQITHTLIPWRGSASTFCCPVLFVPCRVAGGVSAGWLGSVAGMQITLVVLASLALIALIALIPAIRLWPSDDPSALSHSHDDLADDHPHTAKSGRQSTPIVMLSTVCIQNGPTNAINGAG